MTNGNFICVLESRNGKRATCNHGVMEVAKHQRSVRVAQGDSQV